jgi:NAD dependent epimerase/dehydratase family enzyme
MDEMAAAIGEALQRPSWLRTPAWPLRLLFGEMADELILNGQRVWPSRLQAAGYSFHQPELRAAVRSAFAEK